MSFVGVCYIVGALVWSQTFASESTCRSEAFNRRDLYAEQGRNADCSCRPNRTYRPQR